jgi:hypothetical protein
MQKPSDNWKKLRSASLELARRKIIEPLEAVYVALLGASALYLVGFLYLTFASQPGEYELFAGVFISIVAIAGVLVPILTGSALTLRLADRRWRNLFYD